MSLAAAQAEQEILQRNSFEAARRNSLSSSSNSDHSGGMPYNIEALMGGSGAQQGPNPTPNPEPLLAAPVRSRGPFCHAPRSQHPGN